MIGIQIVTHGKMGEGMIDSVDMVLGNTENVVSNELKRGQDIEEFREEVLKTTNEIKSDSGILIFVDMFGASPYNTSLINSKDMEPGKYKVISGINLPLLIEAISSRNIMDLEELYDHILNMSEESILGWENE